MRTEGLKQENMQLRKNIRTNAQKRKNSRRNGTEKIEKRSVERQAR